MKRYAKWLVCILIGLVILAGAGVGAYYWMPGRPENILLDRPATWATPIDVPGAPNLYKVSDVLYRSAQPSLEGLEQLKKLGIKTVVNLRSFHSDSDELGDT
ncbi:MAG: hypothetical protein JW709_12050, partial [Sedimentisphaerales bacterium]|nr:hypothetical protein [Sedimentisphaerales bacterium]